ncbi:hypothetical protein GCM10012280_68670 [Wenjunlia tyrosinilytica]|uniref:Uncharacterized protein n=1 Tax=Wenjunlia tyrosinilytica TaxID=1544741 RepID=A0A917ZYC1_9ACTN|nr:hypothetical protein GCM10012280_68670 [Wenjunlia tyrosinilytica]
MVRTGAPGDCAPLPAVRTGQWAARAGDAQAMRARCAVVRLPVRTGHGVRRAGPLRVLIAHRLQSAGDVLRFVGEDLAGEVRGGVTDARRSSGGVCMARARIAVRWMAPISSGVKESAQGSVSSGSAATVRPVLLMAGLYRASRSGPLRGSLRGPLGMSRSSGVVTSGTG